jgi:hypothetical protein
MLQSDLDLDGIEIPLPAEGLDWFGLAVDTISTKGLTRAACPAGLKAELDTTTRAETAAVSFIS